MWAKFKSLSVGMKVFIIGVGFLFCVVASVSNQTNPNIIDDKSNSKVLGATTQVSPTLTSRSITSIPVSSIIKTTVPIMIRTTTVATQRIVMTTAPVQSVAPIFNECAGHTAICNDGTISDSANHRGTCSHHGGVARWC